jgi:hypothetical protein
MKDEGMWRSTFQPKCQAAFRIWPTECSAFARSAFMYAYTYYLFLLQYFHALINLEISRYRYENRNAKKV